MKTANIDQQRDSQREPWMHILQCVELPNNREKWEIHKYVGRKEHTPKYPMDQRRNHKGNAKQNKQKKALW